MRSDLDLGICKVYFGLCADSRAFAGRPKKKIESFSKCGRTTRYRELYHGSALEIGLTNPCPWQR